MNDSGHTDFSPESDDKPEGEKKGQEKEREEVDLALLESALTLLKAAVTGNGIDPETLSLKSFSGEVLHFETHENFKIEPRTAQKLLHGKENGEVVGSLQEARTRIQGAIEKVTQNPEIWKNTITVLSKRPDLGFALNDYVLLLDRMNKTYVVHEVCTECHGQARASCQACRGTGGTHCPKCYGTKLMVCPKCHGTQYLDLGQGRQPCIRCNGRGKANCDKCQQKGTIKCVACRGSGLLSCKGCSGTGWHSQMSYLEIRARSRFQYNREALPPEVPPLIDNLGPEMVTAKHGDIRIIQEKVREEEINKNTKPDEFIIPYKVRLPWGNIEFFTKDGTLAGKLFGFQPSLVHMPHFLEEAVRPGLRFLDEAVRAQTNVAAKIREATSYRLIAEAALATVRAPQRKALDLMLKKYPFGIRAETLKKTVLLADRALRRVTQKPRIFGMLGGLALNLALFALYFVGPGRGFLETFPLTPRALVAADGVLLMLGFLVVTLCMQYASVQALNRALEHVLPRGATTKGKGKGKTPRNRLIPKAGKSAAIGYAVLVVLYFATIELAISRGGGTPIWYAPLHQALGL